MGISLINKLTLLLLVLLLVLQFHANLLLAQPASSTCNAISCANLGNNIPYPFASNYSSASSSCAPSPSFLLNSCSSHQAYWDAFTNTIPDDEITHHIIGPPAVMGISSENSFTYIDLTWDSDLMSQPYNTYNRSACSTPVALQNLSHVIPPHIDLTTLARSTLRFSSNNVYLLFNCTESTRGDLDQVTFSSNQKVEANTTLCQSYLRQCTLMAEYYTSGQCVQLFPIISRYNKQSTHLGLQQAMHNLGCTHFQFFVTKAGASDATPIEGWSKAIIQLQWTLTECWSCVDTHGSCVVDGTAHTFETCTNCTFGPDVDVDVDVPDKYSDHRYCTPYAIYGWRSFKIMVSVLGIICTLILVLLALFYWWRIRRSMKSNIGKVTKLPKKSAWPRQELSSRWNESLHDFDLHGLSERPMEYSYSSIASATSSFSSIVGEGGFGVVFKGTFSTNDQPAGAQEIAVKVLEVKSKHSRKQFLNEVAIIGRIHHVNVVRLLGFCVEQEEHEMLVYEYVVNGSLDTWLFSSTKRAGHDHAKKELDWGQRYGIALGVAKGLSYLHEECRHRIVHCDIKPHNILLDACMCPKISDFGLARLMSRDASRVVTLAKGTPGYMAPEFWVGGTIHLSTKADVYSYGMVLLELISGRRNFALGCPRFPAVACEAAMRGDFQSIIDVRLQEAAASSRSTEEHNMWQQVRTAVFVALWCIQEHPASRPCMSEVAQYLEGTMAVSEQPPRPAIASTYTSIDST